MRPDEIDDHKPRIHVGYVGDPLGEGAVVVGAEHRGHMCLAVEAKAVVHAAIQVDGQLWDTTQGCGGVDQNRAAVGTNNAAGNPEVTIKP